MSVLLCGVNGKLGIVTNCGVNRIKGLLLKPKYVAN
jgi:hypothetical protein